MAFAQTSKLIYIVKVANALIKPLSSFSVLKTLALTDNFDFTAKGTPRNLSFVKIDLLC